MADNLPGGQPVLTFYTKPGDDFVPGIEQDGTIVSITPFSCGEHEVSKFFFVSGVPKETITVYQDSSWFTVDGGSVYEDANNPNERCLRITVKPNAGLERTGLFTVVGDGTMSYLVQVSQFAYTNFKLSGMTVLNATCTSGGCNIDKYHYSCNRKALIVLPELPERGEEGTTYFIGNHTMGDFEEYVWSNASGWVKMGVVEASLIEPATTEKMGLAKISTDSVVVDGADVGMNGSLQLKVPMATHEAAGAVKLGSMFEGKNAEPYRVEITADDNSQLVFNLKEGGSLKYKRSGDKRELSVVEAADGQKGVVGLTSSLTGLTDSEIEARRNTHAASVGLVLDGLESYVRSFVTDARISSYFEAWASGKNLAEAIWSNNQSSILSSVTSNVVADDKFKAVLESQANMWLSATISDEYIKELFLANVIEKTEEVVNSNWTTKIEETIDKTVANKLGLSVEEEISEWFSSEGNVKAVSDIVAQTVSNTIVSQAGEKSVEYTKGVFSGINPITINGEVVTFPSWASSVINGLVNSQTSGVESKIQAAKNESIQNTNRRFISGLSKVVLHENANGETAGVFSYANSGYKFIAIKVSNSGQGGSYTAVLTPIDVSECLAMGLGSNFAWEFHGGNPEAGIGGIVSVTDSEVSISIKYRWADYADARLVGIYAWK
jgi:hypothetical protein